MSIFKNANEAAYVGGRKHWTDVIKNSGSGELLIWKQPEEDFNTNSTLIVMPGEQAIFINNGEVVKVFEESGRYKLDTQNYPFISRLRNAFSGGVSTFNCVVYFVRSADSKEITWGTTSPIKVRDKIYNIQTDARVRGSYKVRITNPQLFLTRMIGNNVNIQTQQGLEEYFANEFQSKFKSVISKFLNSLNQELIGLDAYLDELSDYIQPHINDILTTYGLECVKFALAGLDIDTTKYDQIDVTQIDLIARTRGAQGAYVETVTDAAGKKATMDILGDAWLTQQGVNILDNLSNNPGAGGAAAVGAGIGMGAVAGGVFGGVANQVFSPVNPNNGPVKQGQSGRFQQQNAYSQQQNVAPQQQSQQTNSMEMNYLDCLTDLMRRKKSGAIDQEEYDFLKAEIDKRFGKGE